MKTQRIISTINQDFAKTYKNAAPFVGSGALWNFCMNTISDPIAMSCIAFTNDMGVPPSRLLSTFTRVKTIPLVHLLLPDNKVNFWVHSWDLYSKMF